jgi:hypothetical protein
MRVMKGLEITKAKEGYHVVSLHYKADPYKNTKEWLEKATRPYPGGINNPYWRKEYELDFEAVAGQPIYADLWRDDIHLLNPFKIPPGLDKYIIIDPGWRNPLCCLWIAINYDDPPGYLKTFPPGSAFIYREHYHSEKEIPWHRAKIKALTGNEKIRYTLIDPKARDKTLAAEKSIFEHFKDNKNGDGIRNLKEADNNVWDGIQKVRELLAWQRNEAGELSVKPKLYVFKTCINTIREFKFYCWEDYVSDSVKERKDPMEKPRKKDDHAMDCIRYFANAGIKPTRIKPIVLPPFRNMQKERSY